MDQPGDAGDIEPIEEPDPDDEARKEAFAFMGRRMAMWGLPLLATAVLLTALGIPWWISAIAMSIAMVILVFELDI